MVFTKGAMGLEASSKGVLNHPTPTALAWWHSVCFPYFQVLLLPRPPPLPPHRFHLIQHWLYLPLHLLPLPPLPQSPLLLGEAVHISILQ